MEFHYTLIMYHHLWIWSASFGKVFYAVLALLHQMLLNNLIANCFCMFLHHNFVSIPVSKLQATGITWHRLVCVPNLLCLFMINDHVQTQNWCAHKSGTFPREPFSQNANKGFYQVWMNDAHHHQQTHTFCFADISWANARCSNIEKNLNLARIYTDVSYRGEAYSLNLNLPSLNLVIWNIYGSFRDFKLSIFLNYLIKYPLFMLN